LIYIFAPLGNPSIRTRLVKFINCYQKSSEKVHFIGWARDSFEKSSSLEGVSFSHILSGGGYGAKSRKFYPLWIILTFFKALTLPQKSVVHALGWESAFPVLLASIFKRHKVIFDDADRFSLILSLPNLLTNLLGFLERITSNNVAVHVIPSFSRYQWRNKQMMVIRNTPTSWDIQSVLSNNTCSSSENSLTIYINGWVGNTRGALVFLNVFSRLAKENRNILINFAGRVDSDEGLALLALPNVINRGSLTQEEALKLYAISDVVITYYDPSIPINIKAESNKWGDCVAFKTPFIVNSEVLTACEFVEAGCAWSIAYNDEDGLYRLLLEIESKPELLDKATDNFRVINTQYMVFDENVDQLIKKVME
jgi:glycosyltransferase involved in cell wall biosynthesis